MSNYLDSLLMHMRPKTASQIGTTERCDRRRWSPPDHSTLLAAPINVVDVSIGRNGMKDPAVLLTFTALSAYRWAFFNLNFEITKALSGAPVNVGSTYTFSTLVNILEAEAFSFQYFDNNLAAGVYTYSVQLSTNSVIDVTPGLTVNNATLSALAVDNNPA
jgi:hypothetical protein